MPFLALAALAATATATPLPQPRVFTIREVASLSAAAKRTCGYATPKDLTRLPDSDREKVLACFVEVTVKRAGAFLPRSLERGADLVSVANFQGLPVFAIRFAADHPRASVPKDQSSQYDDALSNRTCNDAWLGNLIDAGMVDGAQAGAAIVYKMMTNKDEVLALIAVAQCSSAK